MDLGLAPRENIPVEPEAGRASRVTLELRPEPQTKYDIGYTGLNPYLPPVVGALVPGYPGEKAGLKAGDRIVSVGGSPTSGYYEVVRRIREAAAEAFAGGAEPDRVRRRAGRPAADDRDRAPRGGELLADRLRPDVRDGPQQLGLVAAFAAAWQGARPPDAGRPSPTVGRLFRGTGSMRQLSGPIDIAKFSGEAARTGPAALLGLMGMLSLQLGILNLLPIPLLDGGQIFVTLLESVARRDFSAEA